MWPHWILFAIIAAVTAAFVLFSIVLIAVAVLEKQPIRELAPLERDWSPSLLPYACAMNSQIEHTGLACVGYFAAASSRMDKTITTAWLSPDRTIRVVVSAGRMAKLKVRRTTLVTRLPDGRKILTTDEFGMADLSGLTDRLLLLNANFPELWRLHQERVSSIGMAPLLQGGDVPSELAEERQAEVERLIEMGYAKFIDPAMTKWRFTLRGAWACWRYGFLAQIGRSMGQTDRSKLPRPGD